MGKKVVEQDHRNKAVHNVQHLIDGRRQRDQIVGKCNRQRQQRYQHHEKLIRCVRHHGALVADARRNVRRRGIKCRAFHHNNPFVVSDGCVCAPGGVGLRQRHLRQSDAA